MVQRRKRKHNYADEVNRCDLKRALKMVSRELDKGTKNTYNIRSNRVRVVCGSREFLLGGLSKHQSHCFSTSCNMLLNELRTCIGYANWPAAATIVKFLLKMNGTLMPLIWRTSLLILLYHENASHQSLNSFLEQCLGLRSVFEKRCFLKGIFSIDGPSKRPEEYNQSKLTDFGLIRSSQDAKLDLSKQEDEDDGEYYQLYF